VRRELEDTIEYKGTALEENITPVPTIVLDDVVRFRFYPEVECDQCETANPS
jgi:hypothetical protein